MGYTKLPKGVGLQIEGKDVLATVPGTTLTWLKISDHNRSEITVGSNRIQQVQRMANGTLRKFFIADKKTFSMSWNMLPTTRTHTADGNLGAEDLRRFYASEEGKGTFRILLNFAKDGTAQDTTLTGGEVYTVSFTEFSAVLQKRGLHSFWTISMTLEEV
jgi:hypothetical protein